MTDRSPDLHEVVRDLTQPRTHRTTPDGKTIACLIRMPSLLDQLAAAIQPSSSIDSGRPGYQSGTAARLEAIATDRAIAQAADAWLARLHTPGVPTNQARIAKLYAQSRQLNRDTLDELTDDIHTWWTWARFATGWDTPPFTPNNTCPNCSERGSLRIRVDDRLATCVECRATWDRATIGILGEHIRYENGDEPMPNQLEIRDEGHGHGTVLLNGDDISSAVAGYQVTGHARHAPEVTLDLNVLDVLDVSTLSEPGQILIQPATAEVLVRLGWTPPDDYEPGHVLTDPAEETQP